MAPFVAAAGPAAAATEIDTAGPLTSISITADLACQVFHTGDSHSEFYGGDACGTLAVVGGTLYGPANIPAGGNASPLTPFTPVSQAPVTGAGTPQSPYAITTVVDAGGSGIRLTETDTYVLGSESYRTDVSVANSTTAAVSVRLYRAADCYLQDSDLGYGMQDSARGGIGCSENANNSPQGRIEEWVPITAGSHAMETFYGGVWAAIGAQSQFDDTCDCSTYQDNGAGLEWDVSVPAGGQTTVSHLLTFSPAGNQQALNYVALGDSIAAGEGTLYGYVFDPTSGPWGRWSVNPAQDTENWTGTLDSNPADADAPGVADCHRSPDAYPYLVAAQLGLNLTRHLACTSASAFNGVLEDEAPPGAPNSPAQLGIGETILGVPGVPDLSYDSGNPDIVTLTLGADDVHFSDVIAKCLTSVLDCNTAGEKATIAADLNTEGQNLGQVLDEIHYRGVTAGHMPIVAVTTVYDPFPPSWKACDDLYGLGGTTSFGEISPAEMTFLRGELQSLNNNISTVAHQHGAVVVDLQNMLHTSGSGAEHGFCSSDPWVYGLGIDLSVHKLVHQNPAPFHPTAEGQQQIANRVEDALRNAILVGSGHLVNVNLPSGAGITFTDISTGGSIVLQNATGTSLLQPATPSFQPESTWDISTSANYTGGIQLSLPTSNPNSVIFHYTGGSWQQVPSTNSGGLVTGTVTSLSPFAVGVPAPALAAAFASSVSGYKATLDAGTSTVASGSITSYHWNFGDGTTANGSALNHTYTAPGDYQVTLTVTSDAGATAGSTQTVTIVNQAPTATLTGDANQTAGAPAAFDSAASTDPDGTVVAAAWDFGDGTPVVEGASATHIWATPGDYTVTLGVYDNSGDAGNATELVHVAAAAGGGGGGGGGTPTSAVTIARLAGADRFATAVAASQAGFPSGNAGAVVLASGANYPDALVGGPLAKAKNAPLLLTSGTTLPGSTKAEIQRVLPRGGTVYVLGGTTAVPTSIDTELTGMGYQVARLAGTDRYSTSVAVADAVGDPSTVLLASGVNFPDALAAGPAAASIGGVVLLTADKTMAAATSAYLSAHPGTVYAIGGPAAAADPAATAIVGTDRYATAAQVATKFFSTPTQVGVATGINFPDALSGGALLARTGGPLLLVTGAALPTPTSLYLTGVKTGINTARAFGGVNVVSDTALTAVAVALGAAS